MTEAVSVAIVGGGPVGIALAIALADAGIDVAVLEARPADLGVSDPRPIALSYGSRLILERLGVWDSLGTATPIHEIRVSQKGGFGRVAMRAAEAGIPALGYVVDYARLHTGLSGALAAREVRPLQGAMVSRISADDGSARIEYVRADHSGGLAAQLVAVADGGMLQHDTLKVSDYRQSAVVATVETELPHRQVAYERFTPAGPIGLLPFGDRCALVWSLRPDAAESACAEAPARFLERLQAAFGSRLGRFTAVGLRSCFPLVLKVARAAAPRTVHVGNAAQMLHPVAGQGFNLGLRDAWELAREIESAEPEALGSDAMLEGCARRRRIDRGGGIGFTDALVRLFSNDFGPLRAARGVALAALDAVPPAKGFLIRRMIFGARG